MLCAVVCGLACDSDERELDAAREQVPLAIAREDRQAAVAALADLRGVVPEEPAELVELAELFSRAGEAPDALWLLEVGAEKFPNDPDVRLALARTALLVQNPALAVASAGRWVDDTVRGRDALLLMAEAQLDLGDLDAAVGSLDRARDLDPSHPASHLARVQLYLAEGRTEEASAAADAALAALGDDPESLATFERVRAQLQIARGEHDAAQRWLTDRLDAVPSDLASWQLWIALAQTTGDAGPLRQAVDTALAADPTQAELEMIRASAAALERKPEEADAALQRYAEGSASSLAVVPWVQRLMARGDLDAAEAALASWQAERAPVAAVKLLSCELSLDRGAVEAADDCIDDYARLPDAVAVRADYLRGRLALFSGDAQGAADVLSEVVSELDLAPTQYWFGRAREAQGDLEGAARRYGLAMVRDQGWAEPVAALARLSALRGQWQEAEATSARWARMAPDSEDAWALLLQARQRRNERARASGPATRLRDSVEIAREARERFPESARFGVWYAQWLRRAGRDGEALPEIERLAQAHADDTWAVVEIARFHALGDAHRGLQEARAAVSRFPEHAPAQALLAEVGFAAGAIEEADAATSRALELAPEDATPLRVRCRFRTAAGRFAGAVEDCERYLAAGAEDAEAHFWLGVARAGSGQGDTDGAIDAYRRAIALDSTDFRPHNNLADLLAQRGDTEAALTAAQEAYRLSDGNPYVADTVGALYLERGLATRAVSLLEEAHAALPEVPGVRLNLARAYMASDRRTDAEGLLQPWLDTEAGRPHASLGREILRGP